MMHEGRGARWTSYDGATRHWNKVKEISLRGLYLHVFLMDVNINQIEFGKERAQRTVQPFNELPYLAMHFFLFTQHLFLLHLLLQDPRFSAQI